MRSKSSITLIFCLLTALSIPSLAAANDIKIPSGFTQSQFDDLSRQVGLAISYTPMAPASPLGLLGFDVGIEATAVHIDANKSFWTDAVGETPPSYLVFPKIHVQKGLPLGFDVGISYAKVPGTNIGLVAGELKWAVLKGSLVTPAVAIRGDYTKLVGVNDVGLADYGADISISKGFAFVTPYAGIGEVWISSKEKTDAVNFDKSTFTETKGFLGAKFSFFIVSFVAEADFSEVPSYSGRLNLSF